MIAWTVSSISWSCHEHGMTEQMGVFRSDPMLEIGDVGVQMVKRPEGFVRELLSVVYCGICRRRCEVVLHATT